MRSGGMFRLAKVDAEKHRVIAEVLGIRGYPSIFGVKEGVIVDNFVGILPQEEVKNRFRVRVIQRVIEKEKGTFSKRDEMRFVSSLYRCSHL